MTTLWPTESFLGNDAELKNEYISNIEKGAYLHKYAGLWALGLDLLPTSAHRSLDLFVYKGCVCSTEALFKTPTTPKNAIQPTPTSGYKRNYNKNCSIRYTNNTRHELGATRHGEKIVHFSLWLNYFGSNGTLELCTFTGTFLKIELGGSQIKFLYMVRFLMALIYFTASTPSHYLFFV
ncbi:unnamed protein product [Meloidogyne enterolobii]|uniref:Uncharacterized protein n=1 Tax=Meloidogyne enterolobii TaxID=390850 RepID=A0ACB0YS34_MELEN